MPNTYDFPMAGTTATIIFYDPVRQEILLGLRGPNSDAFPNQWCLPGGYLNVGAETVLECAARETEEEIGIKVKDYRFRFLCIDDRPNADPRYAQVINVCYVVLLTPSEIDDIRANDDLVGSRWINVHDVADEDLAFDHNAVVAQFLAQTYPGV